MTPGLDGAAPARRVPRARRSTAVGAVGLLVTLLALAGCSGDDGRTLTVFAASSLRAPMEEVAAAFEDEHGVGVRLSYGGSADLVAQVADGAPADVVATADTATMDRLADDDLLDGAPVPFATNTLTIAVPPGNPADVGSLADLAGDDVRLVACAPQVPCGAAATKAADAADVTLTPVSEEQAVTDVLAKVRAGEADAGLVYVTDVLGADGDVEGIDFAEAAEAVTTCVAGVVAGDGSDALARAFVRALAAPHGLETLARAGFGAP